MTLLISWIGVDDKQDGKSIASLYIASDSRYSWSNQAKYDYGVKLFGTYTFPEIFGFCGDVVFPSNLLGQLIPQIDNGLILDVEDGAEIKNSKILRYMQTSLENYPQEHLKGSFTILHGTRFQKVFKLFETSFNLKDGLQNREIELPRNSTKVFSDGSGAKEFDSNWLKWEREKHNNHRTSRGVYHCLFKTINDSNDKHTGGVPQIVGLYRVKNSRIFGVVRDGIKYVLGKESSADAYAERIEWRNENFERIDPDNLKLIEGAQRQPSF